MTYPSRPQIKQFIIDNMELFQPGSEFHEEVLIDFAGIVEPTYTHNRAQLRKNVNNFQLQKVTIQTKFNRVLATLGIYMAQHNHINYHIKTIDEVPNKIEAMQRQSASINYRSAELSIGYTRNKSVLNRKTAKWL